ncbi:MAG: hypothetical protein SNJ77_07065 [Cytophagales bacterium]
MFDIDFNSSFHVPGRLRIKQQESPNPKFIESSLSRIQMSKSGKLTDYIVIKFEMQSVLNVNLIVLLEKIKNCVINK